MPKSAKFFQLIKFWKSRKTAAVLWPLRFANGGKQTLVAQPLGQQDRPLIQRSDACSHTAAVISMAENMHLRGYAGGNQGVIEIHTGADRHRTIVRGAVDERGWRLGRHVQARRVFLFIHLAG